MKVYYLIFTLIRHLFYRKWGSTARICFFLLVLFGLYLIVSYVSLDHGQKFVDISNDTEKEELIKDIDELLVSAEKGSIENSRPHIPNESVLVPSSIKVGDVVLNCGLVEPCKQGEFAVHIYTGKDHKDEPRLCVDGKYILSRNINGGGRGINVVVIDTMTRSVSRVSHFDTYEKESTPLETLLLTLRPDDLIILLTFDEPTRKMSRVARLLLHELGSALIQNLSYRGSWYLVTQKGLTGFSPFEELHLVESNGWPKHHDVKFCIPFQIKGQLIHPDPYPRSNQPRFEFCEKHGEFPLFCDANVVNDPLSPAPVVKHSSATNRIFSVPIIVMSSENNQFLPLTLETLVRQSGINPSFVVVYYLPQSQEVAPLCDLFGFMPEELSKTSSYCERVSEAFETANLLFPDAKEMILLGENVILAPDFLSYMGNLLSAMSLDSSLISVSAWNENGYKGVSGNPSVMYRVESFSGMAVLVRRNFFRQIACSNDSDVDPFLMALEVKGESIVPDTSRVLALSLKNSTYHDESLLFSVFSREREVNYDENILLEDIEKLHHEDYEKHVDHLISSATPLMLDTMSIVKCAEEKRKYFESKGISDLLPLFNSSMNGEALVVYFTQRDQHDFKALGFLCQCFGLFYHPGLFPRGLYKGTIRFTLNGEPVILVGSTSPFYRHKLPHVRALDFEN